MKSTFPNCGKLVLGRGGHGFIDADRCDQILIFGICRDLHGSHTWRLRCRRYCLETQSGNWHCVLMFWVQTVDVAAFRRVSSLRCEAGDAFHML